MTLMKEERLLDLAEKITVGKLTQEEFDLILECRKEQVVTLKKELALAESILDNVQKSVKEYHSYKMELLEEIYDASKRLLELKNSKFTVDIKVAYDEWQDLVNSYEDALQDYRESESLNYSR